MLARGIAAAALVALGLLLPGSGARGAPLGLPLDEQVGQLVLMSFQGTSAPRDVRRALHARHAAGVILFGGNVVSRGQLRALTAELRASGGRPLVAVDQEGGAIRRIPWAGPVRSPSEQVAAGTVRQDATAAAQALRALGIDVNLAPVADVPSVRNAVIRARAYSSDPTVVAAAVRESVRGWRAGGVASTVKHFPGIGGASRNTDRAVVTVTRSRAALERVDLAPFRAAIAAGAPLVMVGHARYPALDPAHVASQSRTIVHGLLREELGFDGVVVTDALEARAALSTGPITTVAERAIRAGADLVLLADRRSYAPVYAHLLAEARADPAFRARVREASARVWRLKAAR